MIDNNERFARVKLILGEEGLSKLQDSCVMVLGLGGVGSNCAEALARGGVGSLILIDMDVVDITNMNRQAVAYTRTIGRPKAEVMEEIVYEINPECKVYSDEFEMTPSNTASYLSKFPRPDYVIDCIDLVLTKARVAKWALDEKIPFLAAMGAGNKLDPSCFKFTDISKTYNCPLSKMMRKEYKKLGIKHLEVCFSDESPIEIKDPKSEARAHRLGTMSYMPPILGLNLAGKVIRRLSGLEEMPKEYE